MMSCEEHILHSVSDSNRVTPKSETNMLLLCRSFPSVPLLAEVQVSLSGENAFKLLCV
jgi:hypothetical protein